MSKTEKAQEELYKADRACVLNRLPKEDGKNTIRIQLRDFERLLNAYSEIKYSDMRWPGKTEA